MTDSIRSNGTSSANGEAPGTQRSVRPSRRRTSHLKDVPDSKELRVQIRTICHSVAEQLDRTQPVGKDELETLARRILTEHDLGEGYVGWTMVMLASAFWQDQVAAVPYARRLFLLPHCLKHAEGCPADYDQFGLDCKKCGACSIADFRGAAEELGYKVLVAEGSPIVMKIIVSGHVDAIVGVACLNVLEKAIDKIMLAGIACVAIPLLSSDCRNTSVDEDWVREMIHLKPSAPVVRTRTYLHLLRVASSLFEPDQLDRLSPRLRGEERSDDEARLTEANGEGLGRMDPVAATETIAYDFLARGGKYARPFITLAAYDALSDGQGTLDDGAASVLQVSDSVRRVALAIEAFHKASLVHDDIEDDDAYRYGQDTLHRKYGVPTAINVGDYLSGLGYRLVSRESASLTPAVAVDIIDCFADAHMRLSEGQGAELKWRDGSDKTLTPLDALKIYALKTAPAFEAALFAGVRLAGETTDLAQPIKQFAKHLGIAFQILNDLKDWQGDENNKLSAGGDVVGGRPTLLWALAWEGATKAERTRLTELATADVDAWDGLHETQRIYESTGVFDMAHRLVDKYQVRAEAVADAIDCDALRRLLYYLIDNLLERPPSEIPALFLPTLPVEVTVRAES